jgi:hypothetical protein
MGDDEIRITHINGNREMTAYVLFLEDLKNEFFSIENKRRVVDKWLKTVFFTILYIPIINA